MTHNYLWLLCLSKLLVTLLDSCRNKEVGKNQTFQQVEVYRSVSAPQKVSKQNSLFIWIDFHLFFSFLLSIARVIQVQSILEYIDLLEHSYMTFWKRRIQSRQIRMTVLCRVIVQILYNFQIFYRIKIRRSELLRIRKSLGGGNARSSVHTRFPFSVKKWKLL